MPASWSLPPFFGHILSSTFTAEPRPGLDPLPGSKPLTVEAALCPPLVYYVALLFLAPAPPAVEAIAVKFLRNVLAALAAVLFFRLPLAYHVPQSIGLTYQLGLVGVYGFCRVVDVFFISPYLFNHVPRRVHYAHQPRAEQPLSSPDAKNDIKKTWSNGHVDPNSLSNDHLSPSTIPDKASAKPRRPELITRPSASDALENMTNESYTSLVSSMLSISGPSPIPVLETAHTEPDHPTSFHDRAAWALELELSMRGTGFTWTTADIRHTRKTWLPTVHNRLHSILTHAGPTLLISWVIIRHYYIAYIQPIEHDPKVTSPFDDAIPFFPHQIFLTLALGAFLMAAFSLGHSLFAIALSPLAPSPVAFFPPLYSTPVWEVDSVRDFWSRAWHRLFARLFLVYGVWPGEWLERMVLRKSPEAPADVGKVLGGFASSAFVHSFAVRGVLGGRWNEASGEAMFFAGNGAAVLLEEGVRRAVKAWRRKGGGSEERWWDGWVGRAWWIGVLLMTGRNFARGWTRAGLVREMAFC